MIRLATPDDIPELIRMSRLFHDQKTTLSNLPFEDRKVGAVVADIIGTPTQNIAIVSCQPFPVGMILGTTTELIFNYQRVAAELAWWMDPEFRGSRDGLKLIEAFEYWATNIAKVDIIQMSSTHTEQTPIIEKIYKRRGYRLSENAYVKEVTWQQ